MTMTASNGSLRAFLALAKSTLRTAIAQKQRVNLVIGNESAGLPPPFPARPHTD